MLLFLPNYFSLNLSLSSTIPLYSVFDRITIRGARVHNLKNISLELPRNALIVITGVSGSGKSSLAFDTIYAEGQRRYVESLSSYARQFLERMDKPDVDLIQGISPAMAIEQKTNTRNPRSTVGTSTEVYDYLRLLYARIGRTFCTRCGKPVERDSVQTVLATLARMLQETGKPELRLYVTFPLPLHPKESIEQALTNLKMEGFFRVVVAGEIIDLNEKSVPPRVRARDINVLVDRSVYRGEEADNRIADSVETAFASGNGIATLLVPETTERLHFNRNFACSDCHITYEEPDPRLFSFNNPFGACPECQGFGRAIGIDMDLVVPNRGKSIREGAIQPWSTPKFKEHLRALLRAAPKAGIRVDVPFSGLTDEEIRRVREGSEGFEGIESFFRTVEKKAYKIFYRVLLSRYRAYTTCPVCDGSRLRPEALQVRIAGKHISDVVRLTIAETRVFIASLVLTEYESSVATAHPRRAQQTACVSGRRRHRVPEP